MTHRVSDDPGLVDLGTYAALSLRYRVVASDAALGAEFTRLYRSCAVSGRADGDDRLVGIELGAEPARDRNEVLVQAMTEIDGASVSASGDDFVLLHASAVVAAAGPVLLIGPSGAGKSTVAAALAAYGWAYVGDEVVGLDEAAAHLLGNPKPWKLDGRSRRALVDFAANDRFDPGHSEYETLVAPDDLGPVCAPVPLGAPVAIVRMAFCEGRSATVTPLTRAGGAEALADQCFNFARRGARALDTVAALAGRAPAFGLEFGDLPAAVAALEGILG